jgi:hypothetical protein
MQHFQNWQSKQQARKTTSTHFAKQKLEFKKNSIHAKNVKMKKYITVVSQNKDEKMHLLELP